MQNNFLEVILTQDQTGEGIEIGRESLQTMMWSGTCAWKGEGKEAWVGGSSDFSATLRVSVYPNDYLLEESCTG